MMKQKRINILVDYKSKLKEYRAKSRKSFFPKNYEAHCTVYQRVTKETVEITYKPLTGIFM